MLRDHPILNPRLLERLAAAGHTDAVVVADAGLPLPPGVPVVDLSLIAGVPSFTEVAGAVVDSLAVEHAYVADEAAGGAAAPLLAGALDGVPTTAVPHEELKRRTAAAHVVVRTGECTPYANVVLVCGTTF